MASLGYVKMTPQIWIEGSSTQRHWKRLGRLSSKAWAFSGGKRLQCETALSSLKVWDVEKGHTDTLKELFLNPEVPCTSRKRNKLPALPKKLKMP